MDILEMLKTAMYAGKITWRPSEEKERFCSYNKATDQKPEIRLVPRFYEATVGKLQVRFRIETFTDKEKILCFRIGEYTHNVFTLEVLTGSLITVILTGDQEKSQGIEERDNFELRCFWREIENFFIRKDLRTALIEELSRLTCK